MASPESRTLTLRSVLQIIGWWISLLALEHISVPQHLHEGDNLLWNSNDVIVKIKDKVKAIIKLYLSLRSHTFYQYYVYHHTVPFLLRTPSTTSFIYREKNRGFRGCSSWWVFSDQAVIHLSHIAVKVLRAPEASSFPDLLKFKIRRNMNTLYCLEKCFMGQSPWPLVSESLGTLVTNADTWALPQEHVEPE